MVIWLTLIVIFCIIVFAISPLSWGKWTRGGWRDLHDVDPGDVPSDIEIRAYYRKLAFENVPTLGEHAILRFHDETLDRLIAENNFAAANKHRIRAVWDARIRGDREALNTYTLYKRIIASMEAWAAEIQRQTLRERYGKDAPVEEVVDHPTSVDPMRLVERVEDYMDEPLMYRKEGAMELTGAPQKKIKFKTKSPPEEEIDTTPAHERFPPAVDEEKEPEEADFKEEIRARAEKFAKKKGIQYVDETDVQEKEVKGIKEKIKQRWGKIEKLESKKDYKSTEEYTAEKHFVTKKYLHYEEHDALETASSTESSEEQDKFKVDTDLWGGAPSEAAEIPEPKGESAEDKAPEQEKSGDGEKEIPKEDRKDDDDDFTELIKI